MASTSDLSVIVDIGTSKMTGLAGWLSENGKIYIGAKSIVYSKGINRGTVYNIEDASDALSTLLDSLEKQLDESIEKVNFSLSSKKLQTLDFACSTEAGDEGYVTEEDVKFLLEEASNVEVKGPFKVLEAIPVAFVVDGKHQVENPVGATGQQLEIKFKIVVIAEDLYNALLRVCEKVGVKLGKIIHGSVAVAQAITTDEEREVGVIVLDIGAGTTNLGVFFNGALRHTAVVPFGGLVVTRDIKEGCAISLKGAESLKVRFGEAMGDFADETKVVSIAGGNGWEAREISFKSLAYIIQARLEEILECAYGQIQKSGVDENLGAGIVVTGGTAELKNLINLVKFKTTMDARKANLVILPENFREELKGREWYVALGGLKMLLDEEGSVTGRIKKKKQKHKLGFNPRSIKEVVQGALGFFEFEADDDLELK